MPDDLKSLLEENLKISKKILENTHSLRKAMIWSRVWTAVKIFIILVPIILGAIFLPPLLKKYTEIYSSIFGKGGQSGVMDQFKNINPATLQDLLKLAPPKK